jgi:hypothetical protein
MNIAAVIGVREKGVVGNKQRLAFRRTSNNDE